MESAQERPTTIFRAKGADQEIHKLYRRAGGRPLCLYLAYYEQQTHAKEVGDDFITELIESAEAEVKLVGGEGRLEALAFGPHPDLGLTTETSFR